MWSRGRRCPAGPGLDGGARCRAHADDADPGERLVYLEEQFQVWIERFEPDRVAIERVFADVNVASVMTTAHASAVAILVATKAGLPVGFHTPTEVKAAVTGSGRADKAQVTSMVQRILGLADPPRPADAADALALAVCHAWRGSATDRLQSLARAAAGGAR